MRVDRISYQKNFQLAPYITERIGVEVQLDEGDTPGEGLQKAREMVEQFHREANPHLYAKVTIDPPHLEEPSVQLREEAPPVDRSLEGRAALIDGAQTLEELATYKKNLPRELNKRYMDRVKQLSRQLQNQ